MIEEQGLDGRVRLVGEVPQDQARDFLVRKIRNLARCSCIPQLNIRCEHTGLDF